MVTAISSSIVSPEAIAKQLANRIFLDQLCACNDHCKSI
jgi:hypothetical protein